jgi:hypothetical protein
MPTAIRVSTPVSKTDSKPDVSKQSDSSQFGSIALFCGIGLLISLAAVLLGVQGVWF